MLNKKRTLSMLLAAMMAGSMLVSCGGGETTDSGKTDNKGSGTTASESTEEKVHKLSILGQDPTNGKDKDWSKRDEYPTWQAYDKMLKEHNIELDFELVSAEQYTVVVQTRMASGSNMPDIVNITNLDLPTSLTLAEQGVILEINDLIEKYSDGTINKTLDAYYPNSTALVTNPDGDRFWFPSLHHAYFVDEAGNNVDHSVGYALMIRKDWLDKLNIPVPTTMDEFHDALLAFREQDANGDGQANEVIVMDPGSFGNGIAQNFGLSPELLGVNVSNQTIDTPWYQEGVKPYFEYMKKLVEDGIFDTTGFANLNETINQRCTENMLSADFTYCGQNWWEGMCSDQNAYYMDLDPMQALDGVTPTMLKEHSYLTWMKFAITKACKDLEGAIALFDMLYSEENLILSSWGIEGTSFAYDENGHPYKMEVEKGSREEGDGRRMTSGFFPQMRLYDVTLLDEAAQKDYRAVEKEDWNRKVSAPYNPWYSDWSENFLALPTMEENSEYADLITEASTYSEELSTKLLLGQIPMEEFDKHVEKFKELNLDRLVEIQQGRLDRYVEFTNK